MAQKFAFIGPADSIRTESKKLSKFDVFHITGEPCAEELLRKIEKNKITHVVCVETRNGQTSHWASEIKKFSDAKNIPIEIFGINIPAHPHRVEASSMKLVKRISCATEILAA